MKLVSCCRKAFRSRLFLPSELPSGPDVGESVRTGESPFGGTAPDRRDRHHYPADPGSAGVQCPAGEPAEAGHLGQALRRRSSRSSRRANRSPTALYWTTTGSVCCCSAAPKGWAGSNTDPGNGSSSGKQLGLFPDRLHEGCSSFDFRGRRPDGGKALPFGAKGVGWCDWLQPAGVFRLQQSARRSAKPCQGGGERFGVRPACRVSQCFL